MKSLVLPLWNYREFIIGSAKREFQSKYRNSLLGAMWTIFNPLAMIVVYTLIFSQIMGARLPGVQGTFAYSIYICTGILTWGYFSEIVSRAQNTFLENANLLKKISFPRLCLPLVVVVNASVNFTIIFSLFTTFLLLTGNFPGWAYFALLPVLLLLAFFAISLGITVGILNVFFRDVGQLFSLLLQFWFWFTPIIYPISILPEKIQPFMNLNPIFPLMQAFQTILVNGVWPDWFSLLPTLLLSVLFFIIGFKLFRSHSGEMVDEL